MSPHDPSLFSLLNSLFEPNFLILVTYFCINIYLAFRVIRIATKRYRQLKMTPSKSGELGLVRLSTQGDSDILQAHEDLFRIGYKRNKHKTDTPVADALIRLATWAFSDDARNAKRIFGLLALLSLASTWYYMLTFLRHSYLAYLERCHLASYPLPPTRPPFDFSRPALLVPALHLRILRISQWLASLSLFKEAWMEVIKDATSWWWSSEICIIAVGAWALFLRHEAERLRIPHVWTVMALGQLVAISFAFNLFNLAVIYRLDTTDLLSARSDTIFKAKHRVIRPLEDDAADSPPKIWPQSEHERLAEARPWRVSIALPRTADDDAPAAAWPSSSMPPTPRRSPSPNVRLINTRLTVQRTPLPPRPTFMDKVAQTMQRCIPEMVGMPFFVFAGLSSVLQHPNSFTKVMVMHGFPLFISLYPAYHELRPRSSRPPSRRAPFTASTPKLITKQILVKMLSRSEPRIPVWKDAKVYYLGLGVISIMLRLWLTLACFFEVDGSNSVAHRAWRTITVLFPTTFLRHPAQSSISSDHVCVALSASIYVLIESGLWLWKAAVASPSSRLPGDCDSADETENDDKMRRSLPTSIRLDRADRKVIEAQACAIVALLALSPLLGGSATLSLYLAVRCTWVQRYEKHRGAQDDKILHPPRRPDSEVIEDEEEVHLLENEEGERYMEVRKMHVSEARTRNAAAAGRRQPVYPTSPPFSAEEEEEEEPMTPPSSAPSEVRHAMAGEQHEFGEPQLTETMRRRRLVRVGTAESEVGTVSSVEDGAGRRSTPVRNRHPSQRYGEVSPVASQGRRG
ncbi:uncharacterized protein SPSC_04465 [Sporisorium scitamineum]|uniref:Uncharacterized protein n=1 Tax=Sporisorium scitamineum TaxID=49012 RepID=A0A0F7S666_9BASI|nr:uncharacterized protein SPSC_04465 [Sporisorium scitamineum]CDW96799.1 hypothetical protein [Sporisorium scitamineum]